MAQATPWEMTPEQLAPHTAPPMLAPSPAGLGGQPRLRPLHPEQTPDESATEAARRRSAEAQAQIDARNAASPTSQAAEAERKASSYLIRAIGSNHDYEQTGVGARNVVTENMRANIPGVLNSLPVWAGGNTPERQVADHSQDEFIAATLRQDSGAAIPPEELAAQRRIYFPNPSDGPEAAAAARRARRRAIEGLLASGGRGITPEVRARAEEYLSAFNHLDDARTGGAPDGGFTASDIRGSVAGARIAEGEQTSGALPPVVPPPRQGPIEFGAPPPSGPEGGEAFQRDLQAGLQAGHFTTAQQIVDFGRERGFNIDPAQAQAVLRDPRHAVVNEPVFQASDISDVRGGSPRLNLGMFGHTLATVSPESVDASIRGAADTLSLGSADRIAAAGGTLFGGGTYDENLRRQDEIDAYDAAQHPIAHYGGQVAGGLLLPVGAETLAGRAAVGAAYGGAYGFQSGRGTIGNRIESAAIGAGLGAGTPTAIDLTGRAIRPVANAVVSRFGRAVTPEAQDVARAAAEEGVDISQPIVDPASRTRMARLDASVGGNAPVRDSLARTASGIEERAAGLVPGGVAAEPGAMGQRVQTAARRSAKNDRARVGRVYDRADAVAQTEGAPSIQGREVVQTLDTQIARLERNNTEPSTISYLRMLRGAFVDADGNLIPKTIADIRDIRTGMRGEINQRNLAASNAERLAGDAIDAAGQDITRDFGANAPTALRLYNQADRQWRVARETERQIVERVTGPADNPILGSEVMSRVQALAKGSTPHLRRLWATLPKQDALDLAATIASRATHRAENEAFSPAQFVGWAERIPPSARVVMFGQDGARSIANLAMLSSALKQTVGRLNNSGSGVVRNYSAFMRDLLGGNATGAAAALATGGGMTGTALTAAGVGAATTLIGAGARRLSARSLMSPDMSRWLANGVNLRNPAAVREHIARLGTVAARDPAIAQEALGLRQALLNAVNDNVERRAAASQPDDQQQNAERQ